MKLFLLFLLFFVHQSNTFNTSQILHNFLKYEDIVKSLTSLSKKTDKVDYGILGTTNSNKSIPIMKISMDNDIQNKSIILIDAGIHAREWMSISVALYLIHQLGLNKKYEYMLENTDWYIIPILNVDGYVYSQGGTDKLHRLWRKNRTPGKECPGVDLNRNWGFHWAESRINREECHATYAGPHPFSEPETQALRDIMLLLRPELYISLHTYGEFVMYPWSYTSKVVSKLFERTHKRLGNAVARAINKVNGARYNAGRHGDTLYKASGISTDWAVAVAKIPLTFTIEIGNSKEDFTPPTSRIIGAGKEIFEGMRVLHKYVEKHN